MTILDEDVVISVNNLSKVYKLYNDPKDRLKESLSLSRKKYHKEFHALNNISFKVKRGETIGIIGKNGSGKSTLLKILTGVLSPSEGEVFVKGKIAALLELGAGFNPEYTGMENIFLQGTIIGFTKEQMRSKVESILQFAEIGDYINQPVRTYSSGMFARLAFAVAINVEPEILIVDEALAVGDVRFQAKCFKKFEDLKEQGITILFVTHDVFSVRNMCDRAVWINQGELLLEGDTSLVTAKYMEYMNSETLSLENVLDIDEIGSEVSIENKITNFNFINRWGKDQGAIKYVELINSKGKNVDVFETGERIKIIMGFAISEKMNKKNLSVAFSIKNKLGLDLIVSTTNDFKDDNFVSNHNFYEVSFEFYLPLNTEEYVLNLAIEDRQNTSPEYYDYIEGAAYFRVVSENYLFGIFIPEITQEIIGK
ncbi:MULTISPECIES: ABC transporter ATP-binding protein [Lysinibacillus]|uniref:ABC transporter ATP-binding protein n=1 Tax=Lysinibacillus xylanilyticus TaxID=582475 RepID=A0ABV3VWN1_9BACI